MTKKPPVPKTVPIMGAEIPVIIEKDKEGGEYLSIDLDTGKEAEIRLGDKTHRSYLWRMAVHESMHAIFERSGMCDFLIEALGKEVAHGFEEMVVTNFEMYLPAVLDRLENLRVYSEES